MILAAKRAGIKEIILSIDDRKDIENGSRYLGSPIQIYMRLYFVFLILSFTTAVAQVPMPAITTAGLQELRQLAAEIADPARLALKAGERHPAALINGRCMIGMLARVNDQWSLDPAHSEIFREGARVGDILSFRLDAHHLHLLDQLIGLEYVELAGKASPTLDKLVKAVRADSVHAGIHLPQSFTGNDVLIGITDWGFDYTHPMFYDTLLATPRVRAAWDQYKNSGPAPSLFGYGSEYTSIDALLAAQSDTANIYSHHTHGTHVAGIAAGSGAGTAYRGVAFESDLLFCTFLIDAAAVMDAFVWMRDIAVQDGKRLVVSMSWGLHHIGTLDGQSLLSQVIDQMSLEGVVFVSSAGNNGDVDFHIGKEFANDTIRSRVQFYPYNANQYMWGQSISMWGMPGGSFSAGFDVTNNSNEPQQEGVWYHTATQPAYIDSFLTVGTDTVFFNLAADAAHPQNGRPHFRLRIKNTHGHLKIAMKATAASGTVHFWNVTELTTGVGNWGQPFLASVPGWVAGDRTHGIGEPASTESLIAVAAYSSETTTSIGTPAGGAIASFSSYGPTLDGRMKPDIAGPGVNVISGISAFTDANFTQITSVDFEGTTYPFARFSGTSMSAPAVAGVAALMLEADPTLTPAEVREIIHLTARTDANTGEIPMEGSMRWGRGKVNAYRAVAEVLGVTGIEAHQSHGPLIWPNPATSEVFVLVPDAGAPIFWTVTDLTGRSILQGTDNGTAPIVINVNDWASGLYLLSIEQGGRISTGRIIRH